MSSSGSLGSSCSRSRPVELLDPRARAPVGLGGEGRVLAGELAGGGEVAAGLVERAGGLDQRGELGVAPAQPPGAGLVGVHRRVGELLLQGGVLGEQGAQPVGRGSVLLIGGLLSLAILGRT